MHAWQKPRCNCVVTVHGTVQEGGEEKFFLHNHLRFTVLFNINPETELSRIVGFEVEPYSVKHVVETPAVAERPPALSTCAPASMRHVTAQDEPQMIADGEEVHFTYDVLWHVRTF